MRRAIICMIGAYMLSIRAFTDERTDVLRLVIHYIESSEWTTARIEAERSRLKTQYDLLLRLLKLREEEEAKLDLAGTRAQNAARRVNQLPDDILFTIFETYMLSEQANPATLAGVCFRWMSLVLGDSGSSVWSYIDVAGSNVLSWNVWRSVDERRIRHFLARSRTHPLHLRFQAYDVPDAIAILVSDESHRIKIIAGLLPLAPSPLFPLHKDFSSLQRISMHESRFPVETAFISAPCPALTSVTLKARAPFMSRALNNISAWASVTQLAVELKHHGSQPALAAYNGLAGLTELERLRWLDCTHSPTSGQRSIILPKLTTLILHGHLAFYAFSQGIQTPSVRHLQLTSETTASGLDDNPTLTMCDFLQPSSYIEHFPLLEIVKFSNVEVPTTHLFSLLANHPTLREVYWQGSLEVAEELIAAMTFVMSVADRLIPRVDRDIPFLTLGHPSRYREQNLEEADKPSAQKAKLPKKTSRLAKLSALPPSSTQLAIGPFGDAVYAELQLLPQSDLQRLERASSSSVFRIGIAAQVAASSPKLDRFIRKWPYVLSIRPYSVDWIFEEGFQ